MNDHQSTAAWRGSDQDYSSLIALSAPADSVFEALTTTSGLAAWWTSVTGDGFTGGELTFSFGPQAHVVMRVDAAQPGAEVSWTCLSCHLEDWVGTTVHFILEPLAEGGTELRFRHAGLTPLLECFEDCKSGWDHFIPSLRAYVETGIGNPHRSAADLARRELRAQNRESSNVG